MSYNFLQRRGCMLIYYSAQKVTEYASTAYIYICINSWILHTKRNIDQLETAQRMAARFVQNFYDYRQNVDFSIKNYKYLEFDSL